jgi:hypothetical protein
VAEQVKLALEAIGLEEQGVAVGLGDMALFGKGAPPALRTVSDGDVPWTPLDEEQEEEQKDEEGEN